MINRLLIANRGEIAMRIIRACREAGITPLGVYSEADDHSPHVAAADAAFCIGPGPASESYLCIDKILAAARHLKADAIHPGYGFLSESAAFAQACVDAELTFVGPSPSVIRLLGDKSAAKQVMKQAGVPIVPGYHGDDQSTRRFAKEARHLGFPILIKASAGGGGRGMRIVRTPDRLSPFAEEARREAAASFGDGRLLLERYIESPRHIEVQIFGDNQGNVVHLMERECSIQRRHQKIIEESPSPALSPATRLRMIDAAVAGARASGYMNAGTVEFLFDETDGSFYFLEVNTRLQVEHPVTEMVTGIDMVRLQLAIAAGAGIGFQQDNVSARGHAVEVRIYAEDPAAGFLPSIGTITQWIPPSGPGIRVDSGVERGSVVSPYYDPMLAKLIVQAETRAAAMSRLREALREFHVLGVRTNIEYISAIVDHPRFQAGDLSTDFLSKHFADWRPTTAIPPEVLVALATEHMTRPTRKGTAGVAAMSIDPWRQTTGWRNVR